MEGRDVEALRLFLLGVLAELKPARGVPRVLADRALAGVGAKLGGCFLNGDSGRGKEGRFGLKVGLDGLAVPGPTVCENFRADLCGANASSDPVL